MASKRPVASARPPRTEYRVIDPHARPDLHGQYAGVPVVQRGGRMYVTLTPSQARFHLAQGTIEPVK